MIERICVQCGEPFNVRARASRRRVCKGCEYTGLGHNHDVVTQMAGSVARRLNEGLRMVHGRDS